tara:strand:+ start:191 stop:421 length:231 start_codon:yes stop_codon:yes gene_type:complete
MKYKITVPVEVNCIAIVEANNEEEAQIKVGDMELSGCCHGSYFTGDYNANECLVMEDATGLDFPKSELMCVEEYEG